MKTSISLRTLIVILCTVNCVLTAQVSCSSDDTCNFGLCTTSGNSRYCSCLSGFGGSNCIDRPSSSCTVNNITSDTTNFEPFVSLSYNFPSQLVLDVTTNIEESIYEYPSQGLANNTAPYSLETIIYFGNGSFPECTYPNGFWQDFAASQSDCVDRYRLNITFVDAITKCGFDNPSENRTYEQSVTIERKYLIMQSRGTNITRTESRSFDLKIIFPAEANVSIPSVRVSFTASATPSVSPAASVPPAKTYSEVTLTLATSLENFNPTQFTQDLASILNITSDRIKIVSLSSSTSKGTAKQTSTVTVKFQILDAIGSSASSLSAVLVQLVESGDPVLTSYGLVVTGIEVDNSHSAENAGTSSDDNDDNTLLYAVVVPVVVVFLAGLVIGAILIVRRVKKNRPGFAVSADPERPPDLSPAPSFPSPPTPPDMPALPSPPNKSPISIDIPQTQQYPQAMSQSTRMKSRQVTLQLMTQLQQMRQQTATRTKANNNNNNNNNGPDTLPLSRPPSYSLDPVLPSQIAKNNTRMSQPGKLKQNATQASKATQQNKKPPPKKQEEESDSDDSWIATPDSLTDDSDEQ